MLDILRRSASSWVAKALFAILVVSFAIWGIGDIFRYSGRQSAVAWVGDQQISARDFGNEFQRYLDQMRPSFGGELDVDKAKQLGFPNIVLQRMIGQALFDQAADDLGVTVSDKVLRDKIMSDPNFKDPGGRFDEFAFRRALLRIGYTEQSFAPVLRRDLARDELTGSVHNTAWAPKTMVDLLYRYRMERRTADTVEIPDGSITDIPEPTDAELVAFHKAHAKDFMAPEYRKVTFIAFGPKDLAKDMDIKEDAIKQAYEDNKSRYVTPEHRTIEQVVFDKEDTAKKAEALIAQGKSLTDAAKEAGNRDVVHLGSVTKDQLPPELREPAFSAPQGKPTAPIHSSLGWHILQIDKIDPGSTKTYAEMHDQIREALAIDKAKDAVYDLSNKLEDTLAGGATLQEAASKLGLHVETYDAIDDHGQDERGAAIKHVPPTPFLSTVFKTDEGDTTELTEMGENGYFVAKVDKITPAAVRPLDKIRDVVALVWKAEERKKGAQKRAEDIAAAVKGGKSLAEAAAPYKLDLTTTQPFLRSSRDVLPPSVVTQLFKGKPGAIATGKTDSGYVVAQLKQVIPADPTKDKMGVEGVTKELRQAIGTDLMVEYGATLEKRYAVQVDHQEIDSLLASQ